MRALNIDQENSDHRTYGTYRHWDRYLCTIDSQSVLMAARLIGNRQITAQPIFQVRNWPHRSTALVAMNRSMSLVLAFVSAVRFDRRYSTNTLPTQLTNDQIVYPFFRAATMISGCSTLSLSTRRLHWTKSPHWLDSIAYWLYTCLLLIHWCCSYAYWSHRSHLRYKYHREYRPRDPRAFDSNERERENVSEFRCIIAIQSNCVTSFEWQLQHL